MNIIFDVKLYLTCKARLLVDGHKTHDPEGSTYMGMVSMETARSDITYDVSIEIYNDGRYLE